MVKGKVIFEDEGNEKVILKYPCFELKDASPKQSREKQLSESFDSTSTPHSITKVEIRFFKSMKFLRKITNGILLILIGMLHTSLAVSPEGGGAQFLNAAKSCFFNISGGTDELPLEVGKTDLETLAFFWFFYFGLLLIPLGLLVHSIEKNKGVLPYSFTVSYLIFVLAGSYMIPNSGMTIIMLPQAIYMLIVSHLKARRLRISNSENDK